MNNFNYFLTGIKKSSSRLNIILVLWAFNFIFALMLIYPAYSELKNMMSHSLINDLMLEEISWVWLGDIFYNYKEWTVYLGASLLIPIIFYMIIQIFFNGGVIASLQDKDSKIGLTLFFSKSAKNFGGMLRLFLLSIPVYLLMYALYSVIGRLLGLFTKNASNAWPGLIVANIKWVVFVILLSIFSMIIDYAKIRLILSESKKSWKSFLFGLGFAFRNFFSAWGLYLINLLVFIIFTFIYMEIEHALPADSLFFIIVAFILQQLYIAGRIFIRINFFASQMELYGNKT